MRLVEAKTGELLQLVYGLYMEAFPAAERKEIALIEEKVEEGSSQVFAIMDGEEFVGLSIFVLGEEIVLLDYFAILPEKRCGGYGSRVFPLFQEQFPGKTLLLEIEDPEEEGVEEAELELRRRRKAFYYRQGMTAMPYLIDWYGVKMEVLTSGTQVAFSEYHGMVRKVYGLITDEKILLLGYRHGGEAE